MTEHIAQLLVHIQEHTEELHELLQSRKGMLSASASSASAKERERATPSPTPASGKDPVSRVVAVYEELERELDQLLRDMSERPNVGRVLHQVESVKACYVFLMKNARVNRGFSKSSRQVFRERLVHLENEIQLVHWELTGNHQAEVDESDAWAVKLKESGFSHVGADGQAKQLHHSLLPPSLELDSFMSESFDSFGAEPQPPPKENGANAPAEKTIDDALEVQQALDESISSNSKSLSPEGVSPLTGRSLEDELGVKLRSFQTPLNRMWKWLQEIPRDLPTGESIWNEIVKLSQDFSEMSVIATPGVDAQFESLKEVYDTFCQSPEKNMDSEVSHQLSASVVRFLAYVRGAVALNILKQRKSLIMRSGKFPGLKINKIFQLVVVGSKDAGKTHFIRRLCQTDDGSETKTTVGFALKFCRIPFKNELAELQLFDISGGDKSYHGFLEEVYAIIDGVIIMYDNSNSESYSDIHYWLHHMEKFSFLQKMVIANRCKQSDDCQRGAGLAKEYSVPFGIVSDTDDLDAIYSQLNVMLQNVEKLTKPPANNNEHDESDDEQDSSPGHLGTHAARRSGTVASTNVVPPGSAKSIFSIAKLSNYEFLTSF